MKFCLVLYYSIGLICHDNRFSWNYRNYSPFTIKTSERQLLFGEVKSSLGAYPGLSKTSYLACKNEVGTPLIRGRHFMFIVFR